MSDFHPHRVANTPTETIDRDPDTGDVIELGGIVQVTRRDVVLQCPDCGRGLVALDKYRACPQLAGVPIDTAKLKLTPDDVIACGERV